MILNLMSTGSANIPLASVAELSCPDGGIASTAAVRTVVSAASAERNEYRLIAMGSSSFGGRGHDMLTASASTEDNCLSAALPEIGAEFVLQNRDIPVTVRRRRLARVEPLRDCRMAV